METFEKSRGVTIIAMLVLFLCASANAEIKKEKDVVKIMASTDSNLEVVVSEDDDAQVYTFNLEDYDDVKDIENELYMLDDNVRDKLMNLLSNMKRDEDSIFIGNMADSDRNVEIIRTSDIDVVTLLSKNKTRAIERMIERGDFSQEELDKLQAALDAKR